MGKASGTQETASSRREGASRGQAEGRSRRNEAELRAAEGKKGVAGREDDGARNGPPTYRMNRSAKNRLTNFVKKLN